MDKEFEMKLEAAGTKALAHLLTKLPAREVAATIVVTLLTTEAATIANGIKNALPQNVVDNSGQVLNQ